MAAADCAEGNAAPPPELLQAWTVEQWGGAAYRDPLPALEIKKMTVARNVYNAFISYRAGSSRLVDWYNSHPQQAEIVQSVIQMRRNAR